MQTIEIDGRPIAVMGGSYEEVEDFVRGAAFKSDMLVLNDEDARPLWSGKGKFNPYIRECFPEEIAVFERSFAKARAKDEAEDMGDYLVFLVKIVDPTDDHGGEDGSV